MSTSDHSFHGSCHCQAITFSVNLPSGLVNNGTCDCSHCSKRGIIWQFAEPGDFVLEKGEDRLKGYQFGAKTTTHQFCGNCGTFIIGAPYDATKKMPFNVRALRDINIHDVPLVSYSGKDREPAYVPPFPPLEHHLAVPEGKKVYEGCCHCQAVRFAVVHDPLEKSEANDCNCSICGGNGTLWIYPDQSEFCITPSGRDNLTRYQFGIKDNNHYFCKTCGVNVYEQENGKEYVGVNVRLLDGCGDEVGKMKIKKTDGLNEM